ncbi:MAG: hypothetical protein K0U47_03140 [Epsilonproteobacteria bacterium]|nr:hypothetical protein [Campylobacterota bacterium]
MDEIVKLEAAHILNTFKKQGLDGKLYLVQDPFKIDLLFDEVVDAINHSSLLKTKLPHVEFVLPSREIANGDAGWIGHFEDRDNKRFFLSDVYDFLILFIR